MTQKTQNLTFSEISGVTININILSSKLQYFKGMGVCLRIRNHTEVS